MFCCIIYFTGGAAFHVGSAISSGEMEQKFLVHFPCLIHFHIILIIVLTEICRDNEHTTRKRCIMSLIICTLYQIKLGRSNQWAAEMGLARGTNGREEKCVQCVGGES